jgi:hypothetical protein
LVVKVARELIELGVLPKWHWLHDTPPDEKLAGGLLQNPEEEKTIVGMPIHSAVLAMASGLVRASSMSDS